MKVAIALHGEHPVEVDLKAWAGEADLVIAADGGANVLAQFHIVPDVVVGDLDGIRKDLKESLGPAVERSTDQDSTDFQKALRRARAAGATSIAVLNYEGSRVDHMLSALFSAMGDTRVRFIGRDSQAQVLSAGRHTVPSAPGIRVSLLPLEPTRVIAAYGLRFDPVGIDFRVGGRDGVSNEATDSIVSLDIEFGALLVFVQRFPGEPHW